MDNFGWFQSPLAELTPKVLKKCYKQFNRDGRIKKIVDELIGASDSQFIKSSKFREYLFSPCGDVLKTCLEYSVNESSMSRDESNPAQACILSLSADEQINSEEIISFFDKLYPEFRNLFYSELSSEEKAKVGMISAIIQEKTNTPICALGLDSPLSSSDWERLNTSLRDAFNLEKNSLIWQNAFPYISALAPIGSLLNEENALKTSLPNMLEMDWPSEGYPHISIFGNGGLGKTYTLLNHSFKGPVVYIPLSAMTIWQEGDVIEKYLLNATFSKDPIVYQCFLRLCQLPRGNGPGVRLILDGLNELSQEKKNLVISTFETIWCKYSSLQVIFSARYDVAEEKPYLFGRRFRLENLDYERVVNYLETQGLAIPPRSAELYNLITTPLLLTLYAHTEKVKEELTLNEAQYFRENNNAAAIIWNYLLCEIHKARQRRESAYAYAVASLMVAPYIAYKMVESHNISLPNAELHAHVRAAFDFYSEREKNCHLPSYLSNLSAVESQDTVNEKMLWEILLQRLCILRVGKDSFQFTHQDLRDFLCAVHLLQSTDSIGKSPAKDAVLPEWTSKLLELDRPVFEFLAGLLKTDPVKANNDTPWMKVWNAAYRQASNSVQVDPVQIKKMLELFRLAYGQDISQVNFSGMDLQKVSLVGFTLTGKSVKHFMDTKIGRKTFWVDGHNMAITALSHHAEYGAFLTASYDGTLRLWDTDTGIFTKLPHQHSNYLRTAQFSPTNPNEFASAGDELELVVWTQTANSEWNRRTILPALDWIYQLAWAPDGKSIVCGDRRGVLRQVSIYDDKNETFSYSSHHKAPVCQLLWTLSGSHFVSADENGKICVWPAYRTNPLHTLDLSSPVKTLVWLHNGDYMIAICEHALYRFETSTLISSSPINPESHCIIHNTSASESISYAAAFRRPEEDLLALFYQNAVVLFSFSDKDEQSVPNILSSLDLTSYQLAKTLCAQWDKNGNELLFGCRDGAFCRITVDTAELSRDRMALSFISTHYCHTARCSAWSSDNQRLAVGYADGYVRIWDVEKRRCINGFPCHSDSVKSVAWSPDGKNLVSASDDKSVRVFPSNAQSGSEPGWSQECHTGPVNSVVWLKDGHILSASDDGRIAMLLDTGREAPSYWKNEHTERIYSLAISPNGSYVVSGGNDRVLCLWTSEGAILYKLFNAHEKPIRCVAWSNDGSYVISCSNDKTVHVYCFDRNKKQLKLHRTIPGKPELTRHKNFIYGTCITADDRFILTASTDTRIGVWPFNGIGSPVFGNEHEHFVWSISASGLKAGRQYAASCSSDGTVRLWDVSQPPNEETLSAEAVLEVIPHTHIVDCDFKGVSLEGTDAEKQWLRSLITANGGLLQ